MASKRALYTQTSRIPKTIMKQAADCIALMIIDRALPAIKHCLDVYEAPPGGSLNHLGLPIAKLDFSSPESSLKISLDHLNNLKRWYWEKAIRLGERDSQRREEITKSLLEVTVTLERLHICKPIHKLCLQVLFGTEAGVLDEVVHESIQTPACYQLSRVLSKIDPLYIHTLRDLSLKFVEKVPINLLISCSKNLRLVHLSQNLCSSALERLRINCKSIEVIVLDLEFMTIPSITEDVLFRTFFDNKKPASILRHRRNMEGVSRSFNCLKTLWLRCDYLSSCMAPFIDCLVFYYSTTKVKVTSMISMPFGGHFIKPPFICPSFQSVSLDPSTKRIRTFFSLEDMKAEPETTMAQPREVDVTHFSRMFKIFYSNINHLQEVAGIGHVFNLRYIYCDDMKVTISPRIPTETESIQALYMYGPVPDCSTGGGLVSSFNQLPNLRVLCLMVKPLHPPSLDGLCLQNLQVLSIHFTDLNTTTPDGSFNSIHCLDRPMLRNDMNMFTAILLKATPNLEILEVNVKEFFKSLITEGHCENVHTLSIISGELDCIRDCILRMPNLKSVMLDRNFEYSQYQKLKGEFCYTSLEISFKNVKCVYPYKL